MSLLRSSLRLGATLFHAAGKIHPELKYLDTLVLPGFWNVPHLLVDNSSPLIEPDTKTEWQYYHKHTNGLTDNKSRKQQGRG